MHSLGKAARWGISTGVPEPGDHDFGGARKAGAALPPTVSETEGTTQVIDAVLVFRIC